MSLSGWETYFEPGESLLWEGAPSPKVRVSPKMIFFAIFGLPFAGAGLFIMLDGFGMLLDGFPDLFIGIFMIVFSLPFTAVGLGLSVGPSYKARMAHRKVRYAVSDRAAYIATRWWGRKMQSYPIEADTALVFEEGDVSNIWFHSETYRDRDGDSHNAKIGFENIEQGAAVYRMLRGIQQKQGAKD